MCWPAVCVRAVGCFWDITGDDFWLGGVFSHPDEEVFAGAVPFFHGGCRWIVSAAIPDEGRTRPYARVVAHVRARGIGVEKTHKIAHRERLPVDVGDDLFANGYGMDAAAVAWGGVPAGGVDDGRCD